jgi:serine/threonine protein kinase
MRLNYHNIIKIEGVFEDNYKIYLVMDYMPNGDLFELIKHNCKHFYV